MPSRLLLSYCDCKGVRNYYQVGGSWTGGNMETETLMLQCKKCVENNKYMGSYEKEIVLSCNMYYPHHYEAKFDEVYVERPKTVAKTVPKTTSKSNGNTKGKRKSKSKQ